MYTLILPEQVCENSNSVSLILENRLQTPFAAPFFRVEGRFSYAENGSRRFLEKYSATIKIGGACSFAILVPIVTMSHFRRPQY
jgi:hypothetical protein